MRKLITLMLMIGAFTNFGVGQTDNPFFKEWKTPFKVPPFSQIKVEHYMPAFVAAMKEQNVEIEAILNNRSTPTFENTILAYDNSGSFLEKVNSVFYSLNAANTNKEMQEIAKQLSPLVTQHGDDIILNPRLFEKVSMVYKNRENLKLDPEELRLLEETYKGFIRGGANLDAQTQERLRQLNKEINMLQLTFGQNLLAETNAYKLVIDKYEDLAGLPEGIIAAAAETARAETAKAEQAKANALKNQQQSSDKRKGEAPASKKSEVEPALSAEEMAPAAEVMAVEPERKGIWSFGLQNTSVIPFLQFSANRPLREKMFNAYINRGNNENENDNKKIIDKLVNLRLEKARLMGYENFASYVLENRMAKDPANVYKLLDQVWTPALAKAKEEESDMQVIMNQEIGGAQLEGWDWRYYSEKQLNQKYQLDEESLKPYFKLENVLSGVFYVANQLYGITFTEVKNAPVYYDGVKLYECKEADGKHLGVLYFDFHPRPSKRGGAWCGSYRPQSYQNGKRVAPVMTIVCNFTAPTENLPALLTADETETLFHEFGHALHGLLKNVKYKGLSGVPRDFVELPSQIMEHWAFEPQVLKIYAKHYISGEVIPSDLVDKIKASDKFGQGFKTTEYLAASYLDMDYHVIQKPVETNILKFEAEHMTKIGLLPQIPPRYRSTYFQHSMTGGYTAGYYSYIWAEVLDADAFEAFTESGDIFNKQVALKFRKTILERGGSKDALQMYIDFRGREPGITPLLKNRGLD